MDFIPDPNEHIHFTKGNNPANKGKWKDLIVKILLVAALAIGIYFTVKKILYKPPSLFDANPFTLSCNEGTYFRPCSDDNVLNSACCPCEDTANCPSAVPSKSFLEDFFKSKGYLYQNYFGTNYIFNNQPCVSCDAPAPGTS